MSLTHGVPAAGAISEENEASLIKELEHDVKEGTHSPSNADSFAEKGDVRVADDDAEEEDDHVMLSHEDQFPIDPNAEEETHQFTIRAVFVGCCLGGVIAASK